MPSVVEFNGVLQFRQQHHHPGAFGRSDLYFICHLLPLTFDLHPDEHEISHCQWLSLDTLQRGQQMSTITSTAVALVQHGLKHGFDSVTLSGIDCKSLYKGLNFRLHSHRVVPVDESRFVHSIAEARSDSK